MPGVTGADIGVFAEPHVCSRRPGGAEGAYVMKKRDAWLRVRARAAAVGKSSIVVTERGACRRSLRGYMSRRIATGSTRRDVTQRLGGGYPACLPPCLSKTPRSRKLLLLLRGRQVSMLCCLSRHSSHVRHDRLHRSADRSPASIRSRELPAAASPWQRGLRRTGPSSGADRPEQQNERTAAGGVGRGP